MSYKFRVSFTCPYCGRENVRNVEAGDSPRIVNCCPDDGGCDREFVADAVIRVETRVRRIEGELMRRAAR